MSYTQHTFQNMLKQLIELEFFYNRHLIVTDVNKLESYWKFFKSYLCRSIHTSIWILVMLMQHIVKRMQLVGLVVMSMLKHVNVAQYWQPISICPFHHFSMPLC